VAAAVLAAGTWDGMTLELSGPEAVSFTAAAAVLATVSGMPVSFADESDEDHVGRLRAVGTLEGYIRWRMAMLGAIRRGEDAYLSDGVQRVLHRPPAGLVPGRSVRCPRPAGRGPRWPEADGQRRRSEAGGQGRAGASKIAAMPWPPPTHMVSRPKPPPRRPSSCSIVTIMRAPVAPIG
jgi:hypothetical protein